MKEYFFFYSFSPTAILQFSSATGGMWNSGGCERLRSLGEPFRVLCVRSALCTPGTRCASSSYPPLLWHLA